eukprot:GHVQ01024399.1.p1 GENE.GHVQ01024399.1~~GHVQ01024399.1.p1  ORF type:complete len:493 (+),score=64.87 GHVQ01024399.1:124-1602(+)
MEFKKLQILPISPRKVEEERANRLWTKYKIALEGKEASAITCVGFLPVSPFDAFVGSATKLQLYDVDQQVVRKKFSMFKEVVRSCAIRSDGRLMCVGDEKGRIRVLEVLNKTVLRRLKGHGSAVHACEFSPNKTHVMSGGNDSKLMYWDIGSGTLVDSLKGHSDFVRSVYPCDDNTWASGSYDGSVRLWDIRDCTTSSSSLPHKAPVERVLALSDSRLLLTAAANVVKIWDLAKTDKEVYSITNHLKTVTGLCVTSDHKMLVTSSLDETVKWQDMTSHKVLHTYKLSSAALCLSLSKHDESFVTGTADGSWLIRKRKDARHIIVSNEVAQSNRQAVLRAGSLIGYSTVHNDEIVMETKRARLSRVDHLLRSFQYKAALDAALRDSDQQTLSLLEELTQRRALYVALRERVDRNSLVPLLSFLYKQIGKDPTYMYIVIETLEILLAENSWVKCTGDHLVLEGLRRIEEKIKFELQQHRILTSIQGVLDMILAI